MPTRELLLRFDRYSFVLLAFLIPLHKAAVPVLIALMLLRWLLAGEFLRIARMLEVSRPRMYLLLFALFYVLHLVGMLGTSNLEAGWFDMEVKLSLIIFPLIFLTLPRDTLEEEWGRRVLMAFVAGSGLSMLLSLGRAILVWHGSGDAAAFYYTRLSWFHHAGYMAMYLNFATVICIYFLTREGHRRDRYLSAAGLGVIFFFMLCVVLLSSKAGILGMVVVLFMSMVYLIVRQRMLLKGILWFLLSISVFYAMVLGMPYSMQRMERAAATVGGADQVKASTRESTGERLLVWQASWEVVSRNFLVGVGTGDVVDELVKVYKHRGITAAARDRLNTHNQLLQTQAGLGIIGSLALVLMLLLPLIQALRKYEYPYAMFLLLFGLNIMVESMLQTQSGVIFYAFFNVLLFTYRPSTIQTPA